MNIETKLSRFSESVRKEAEAQNDIKVNELNEKYNTAVREFERKIKSKYGEMAENVLIQAENQKQKQISDALAEVKRTLMQKRTEYVTNIFSNVLKKLELYFKTADYEQLIVDYINSYKGMSNELEAQIMKRDEALLESIAKRCGVNVVTVDEDFLGGVRIVLDKGRVADCTVKSKFEAEKNRFNKIKIL